MSPKKDGEKKDSKDEGSESSETMIEITIKKIKENKIAEKREKHEKGGITIVKTRELKKDWFTHKYLLPLANLGLPEDADKKQILDRLNDPKSIPEKNTRDLLGVFEREYDGVVLDGTFKRTQFRTKRFKKHAKAMQVKRKSF